MIASKKRDVEHQIVYRCGGCGKPYWLDSAWLDSEVTCPWCGSEEIVWAHAVTGPWGEPRD